MTRPKITLIMASSIDGKITTFQREKVRFSSEEDRALLEYLRAHSDAVLIGAGTLRTDDPPLILRMPRYQLKRKRLGKPTRHPINMVVSAGLNFPIEDSDFFNHPATEKVVLTTAHACREKRERLNRYARIIELPADGEGRIDLCAMAAVLPELNIRRLVLEGGGCLNFDMLSRGLVDEVYLTVCPFVIGGHGSPTSFDGEGFAKEFVKKLRLVNHRRGSKGELFLKYRVQNSSGVSVEASKVFRKGYVIN